MSRYLLRRALSSLIALFLFVSLMFFVTEIVIPGDFTTQFSEVLSAQQRAELQQALGLDIPLGRRYLNWLWDLLHGNLGMSMYGSSVATVLQQLLPYTLLVFFLGTIISFQLGLWLGRQTVWVAKSDHPLLIAIKKYLSGGLVLGAVMFYTAFPPWLTFLVVRFLSQHLVLHRDTRGRLQLNNLASKGLWLRAPAPPQTVMMAIVISFVVAWVLLWLGNKLISRKFHRRLPVWMQVPLFVGLLVGSWYGLGFGPWAVNLMSVAAPALITYVLLSFGETLLIMRTSMMDMLQEDYVTTARAKGAPEAIVRDRHVARTALLPVLSRFIVSFPYMLTGMVIVEDVLNWPGISVSLFDSLYEQDMSMVMGTLLVVGLVSAVARLALDVVSAFLDPRIRYDRGRLGGIE